MPIESAHRGKEDVMAQEGQPERIPSETEVREKLMEYIGSAEYTERRKLENEAGIYLLELVVTNADGSTAEYQYQRKGQFPGRKEVGFTTIDSFTFDESGFATGGEPLFRLGENGVWESKVGPLVLGGVDVISSAPEDPALPAAQATSLEVPPNRRRESGPEIAELEGMMDAFEATYNLEELHKITTIVENWEGPGAVPTVGLVIDTARAHPFRNPARLALQLICNKLEKEIAKETDITNKQYDALHGRYMVLSLAVGVVNRNTVDHTRGG